MWDLWELSFVRFENNFQGGRLVVRVFLSLVAFILAFDLILVWGEDTAASNALTLSLLFASALAIVCHIVAIAHFPQSRCLKIEIKV